MPRYEIRRTSDNALTYVEGDLPLNLMLSQAPGTYRAKVMSAEEPTDIVVPTLTAGTISNVSPVIGATLSVTGSNAPPAPVSTFAWQYSANNSTWSPAGGTNNAATYNTTAQPLGWYRRGSWAGTQGPVFTPSVQVTSASVPVTVLSTVGVLNTLTTRTIPAVNFGSGAPTDRIVVFFAGPFNLGIPAAGDWTCTVDGNSPTSSNFSPAADRRHANVYYWVFNLPTNATGDVVVSRVAGTTTAFQDCIMVLRVGFPFTLDTPVQAGGFLQNPTHNVSQNVAAGSAVVMAVGNDNGDTPTITFTGATQQFSFGTPNSAIALATNVPAATPRTLTAAISGQTVARHSGAFSIEISA